MATIVSALSALDEPRHRAEFYRMWRAGYSAAFPHPRSFETMGARQSPLTEGARTWLLAGTNAGKGVADLVEGGGSRFEEFERALLALGEESGRLDDALRLLGDFYAKKQQLMNAVKKQMTYPLFTGLAASFIAPLPLLWYGATLTAYFVSAFSVAGLLVLGAGGIVAGVAASYGRKPPMARARLARALATAIDAGLPLPRALRLAADASASPDIRVHVSRYSERQLATMSISEALAGCPHMSPDLAGTIQVAEKTGDFRPLSRLAELYEDGFR